MPSLVVYEAFSLVQPGEKQNLEELRKPLGHPKEDNIMHTDSIRAKVIGSSHGSVIVREGLLEGLQFESLQLGVSMFDSTHEHDTNPTWVFSG